jgi:hypothetical protein
MSTLDDALNAEFAPAWRPQAGDTLTGEVVGIGERVGYDDEVYPIITVRTDDGELAFHAFHTVARNELAKARPAIGEVIGVKYAGQKPGARGSYHAYRVVVDRPQQAFNWSRYGVDEDAAEPDVPSDFAAAPDNDDIPF